MCIASILIGAGIALCGGPAIVPAPGGGMLWTPDAARVAPVPLSDTLAWPNDLPAAGAVAPVPVPGGWPEAAWPPPHWPDSAAGLDWLEWVLGGVRPAWATGSKP